MNILWTQQQRNVLDEILDQLIPANVNKGIPSAGSFGVGEFISERAAEDEHVQGCVSELLVRISSTGLNVNPESVRQLESECPESFAMLVRLTYMGYYSKPEIRSLVGVGSWPVHPKGYEVPLESSALMDELTAPVKVRGAHYRKSINVEQN